jgi:hypothetical protein
MSSPSDSNDEEVSRITFPMPDSAQRVASDKQSGSSLAVPGSDVQVVPKQRRAKVILEPGHSPLDWANKKKNSSNEQLTVLISHLDV